jgi:hypothetical protein
LDFQTLQTFRSSLGPSGTLQLVSYSPRTNAWNVAPLTSLANLANLASLAFTHSVEP